MDANTKDVLDGIIRIAEIIVTAVMVVYVSRNNAKINTVKAEVQTTKAKVSVVEEKLDENHKLINGHLSNLLETTKELATEKEKAKHV